MTPRVGICFGTFNRIEQLHECIASLRRAAGKLQYRLYIADGGSRDGTIEYLRTQSDVHLIEQGELLGAVAAFDAAYEAAIDEGADFIVTFNDDIAFIGGEKPELEAAVALLEADESLGGIAFASDRYRTPQAIVDDPFMAALVPITTTDYGFERHHGRVYMNQGMTRRAVHMAVSRAQGDPSGRDYWAREWHTYGADSASGCWIWRLGWRIYEATELRVREHIMGADDAYPGETGDSDALRQHNMAQYGDTAARFAAAWGDPARLEYDEADARQFGGRLPSTDGNYALILTDIYAFLKSRFSGPEAKVWLELGAHIGLDTVKLAAFPGVRLHSFEPDPANEIPALHNVTFNRAAVAAQDGSTSFHRSAWRGDIPWTCSGSIHPPTGHMSAYPDVEFGEDITVPTVALDTYVRERGIGMIDFIWADIQGAERDMILGGQEALKRTRYLYTEYCDTPLYEGQPTLGEILELLPDWKVLADWPSGEAFADVLLENGALA
jgi:FkbM family methyltransferase